MVDVGCVGTLRSLRPIWQAPHWSFNERRCQVETWLAQAKAVLFAAIWQVVYFVVRAANVRFSLAQYITRSRSRPDWSFVGCMTWKTSDSDLIEKIKIDAHVFPSRFAA